MHPIRTTFALVLATSAIAAPAASARFAPDPRWKPLRRDPGLRVWTDEFSNILSVIRWNG